MSSQDKKGKYAITYSSLWSVNNQILRIGDTNSVSDECSKVWLVDQKACPTHMISIIFPGSRGNTISGPTLNADGFGNRQGIFLYINIPSIQKDGNINDFQRWHIHSTEGLEYSTLRVQDVFTLTQRCLMYKYVYQNYAHMMTF